MVIAGDKLEVVDFYQAAIELGDDSPQVLINPIDLRDLYEWDVTDKSWQEMLIKFKLKPVSSYGAFTFRTTEEVPQGLVIVFGSNGKATSIKKGANLEDDRRGNYNDIDYYNEEDDVTDAKA